MRNSLLTLFVLTLTAASTGCVTGGSPASRQSGNVVVVERSKEHPPTWVGAPTERLSEADGVYRYVEISGRMLDLPLGLKQTQLKALDSCRRVMGVSLHEQIMANGGTKLTSKSQAELNRLTDQTIDELHGQYAKVADIYFERLEDRDAAAGAPGAEFFAVYILVNFPKDKVVEIYSQLSRRLSQSGDLGLKRLAPEVQNLARTADLSH